MGLRKTRYPPDKNRNDKDIIPHLPNDQPGDRGVWKFELRTADESHDVVRDVSGAVPPSGQFDVSKQLACGQSENVGVAGVLWCYIKCSQSQFVVEIYRAR